MTAFAFKSLTNNEFRIKRGTDSPASALVR
ncbi:hypothetical protein GGQ71_004940 [Rhizobium taibaishanense]|uniref:Uncharacterized protein n=1 Tax=Allorhizobium taibaishanense TaxID=887144 RepID=A0A7W6MWX2_9HYPH|nr:hypothetical protein [Allorhizobium taibaishanense]